MSSNDSKQKICIEVLADNNIENLTEEVQAAIRNAVGISDDEDISEAVSTVVTGVSPKSARGIVQHAASESGLSTDWNGDDFNVFPPNVEKAMEFLDEEDYESFDDPERSMSRDAYRQAADFRTKVLCEGTDNHDAVDTFILVHDAEGANRSARAFADNVLEHGGIIVQHPVEGVPQEDASDEVSESTETEDTEPSEDAVMDEFEDLVEA